MLKSKVTTSVFDEFGNMLTERCVMGGRGARGRVHSKNVGFVPWCLKIYTSLEGKDTSTCADTAS